MKRVLVIGGNGSGKSTFSRKLGKKTGLPVVHLDKIFWRGNWEYIAREEFDLLLSAELNKEKWIIDGNFERTLEERIKFCDTVFYFDFSTAKCLFGVTERVLKNYGKTRPDMGGNCSENLTLNFIRRFYASTKRTDRKPKPFWKNTNPM